MSYVIKQDTSFTPYYLTSWDEAQKTESFAVRLDRAITFPSMDAAIKVAGAIARMWLATCGMPMHPLKVVSLESQTSRTAFN